MHEPINPHNHHLRLVVLSRHTARLRSHTAEGQSKDGAGSMAPSSACHFLCCLGHEPCAFCSPHSLPLFQHPGPSLVFQGQGRCSHAVSGKHTDSLDHRLDFRTARGPRYTLLELNSASLSCCLRWLHFSPSDVSNLAARLCPQQTRPFPREGRAGAFSGPSGPH